MPRVEAPDVERDLLGRVIDALDTGLLALDEDRHIAAINDTLAKGWGVERAVVVGQPIGSVFESETERWYLPGRGGEGRATREVRGTVAEREVLMRYSAIGLGDSGAVLIRVEDLVDADTEEELFRNTERLISLGELSARVAHEIRNPLTGVRTTVQFVASKLRAGDSRRDDLQDVLKELDRIEQIITDLLLFARPQAARPVPTDLREIVEKVLDNLARRFMDGGIEVDVDLDADIPLVQIDPDMVQQVVLNLAINAIQAMPGGGVLRVTTGLRRTRYKKAYVDVTVADTGPGIPDEVKEKIFDPFFTTRSMGTGLGLSISLQIAREHGGNLTARNLAQGGAAFRFALPAFLTPDDAPAPAEPKNGERLEAKAAEGKAADAKATEAKAAEPREPRERTEAKVVEPRERAEAREKVEEKA
ncbi:MAG TPA: ATP-binding protein [Candidatus Eisenbacteria bacterium]|nr:ATP-binding protein [Candidatus Eisenbacteria bacterium]